MSEEQENLETTEIGTKETKKLEPKNVKIVKATIEDVGVKGAKKVVCQCEHPDADDVIQISSAKVERNGKLNVGGLWFNQDEDKKIRKGSLLADFLKHTSVNNVKALEGIRMPTVEDDSGYLVFKAY